MADRFSIVFLFPYNFLAFWQYKTNNKRIEYEFLLLLFKNKQNTNIFYFFYLYEWLFPTCILIFIYKSAPHPIPRSIQENKLKFRVGYVVINVLLFYIVYTRPNSYMWNEGVLNHEAFASLLVCMIITAMMFFIVQGSDPGYLTRGTVMTSTSK